MTIGKWARLLLLAAPVLAGCKGFFDAPAGGGGGGGTTLTSGVFYVLNQATAQIAAYSVVAGVLTPVTGSPYALGTSPYSIAIAPNGAFLYVSTTSGIFLYSIGTGGALTLGNNSQPVFLDSTGYAIAVDSTSSWLLDASSGGGLGGVLYAIPINSTTGAVTGGTAATTPQLALASISAPQKMAITSDNKFVLVALGNSGTAIIPFAAGTAANPMPVKLTASEVIPVKGTGGAAVSVAVDPQSRLFYVGEVAAITGTSNTGGLRAFNYSALTTISTTAATDITGSPYASGGLAPYSILPTPTSTGANAGAYVYVGNRTVSGSSSGNITGFAMTTTGTTNTLTTLTTTATGAFPTSLAQDSSGAFVFVVDSGNGTASGNPDLEGYNFDATTAGTLDSVLSSTTGTTAAPDPVGAIVVVALP